MNYEDAYEAKLDKVVELFSQIDNLASDVADEELWRVEDLCSIAEAECIMLQQFARLAGRPEHVIQSHGYYLTLSYYPEICSALAKSIKSCASTYEKLQN